MCVFKKHTSHYRNSLFDADDWSNRSSKLNKIYWKKKSKIVYWSLRYSLSIRYRRLSERYAILNRYRYRFTRIFVKLCGVTRRLRCGDQFARLLRDEPNYGILNVYLASYIIRFAEEIHVWFYTIDSFPRLLFAGDSTSAPSQTLAIQETPTSTTTTNTT